MVFPSICNHTSKRNQKKRMPGLKRKFLQELEETELGNSVAKIKLVKGIHTN